MSATRISDRGLAFIEREEGCKLSIYRDQAGHETIGIGHKLTSAEKATGRFAHGITATQAFALLRSDVETVEKWIDMLVKVPLTQGQRDALGSLCFNCGSAPLVQTLGKLLNVGNYDEAGEEFGRWCKALVPSKKKGAPPEIVTLPVLRRRRAAERVLWDEPDELPPESA